MDLDRGALAKIDRGILSGLDHDERSLLAVVVLSLDGTGNASSSRANLSSATPHPESRPPAIQEPQPTVGLGNRFTNACLSLGDLD